MGLSQVMLRAIKRKGYQLPTPIQRKTLPLALSGQDIVGMARTGSGKTAAFVIPMLERYAMLACCRARSLMSLGEGMPCIVGIHSRGDLQAEGALSKGWSTSSSCGTYT